MVPCAYLRVFEPLDGFPPAERDRWGKYVADGQALTVRAALTTESRMSTTRLVTGRPPQAQLLALVRRVGDRVHLCPLQLAERHAVALLAFQEMLPTPVANAFVSPTESRVALREVRQLLRPPHIQESSWEVPLRWFVAFAAEERHFVDPPEGDGPRLTYLTRVHTAMERLDRAITIIEATVADGDELVDALSDLVDWLAHFDETSLLELDYGGLVTCMSPAELALDGSCQELWSALDSLERGDAAGALASYEAARDRFELVRHRYRAN